MIDVRQRLEGPPGASGTYHSLALLEKRGVAKISRLPVSLRIFPTLQRLLDAAGLAEIADEMRARRAPAPSAR
jgi:hypothetical protein